MSQAPHDTLESSSAEPVEALHVDLPRIGSAGVAALMVLFVALLAGLFLLGYYPHRRLQNEILEDAAERALQKPLVTGVLPKLQEPAVDLVLPADILSFQQTLIYPRANGYLKRRLVDIGDRVEAGQLLAEIDTPEVDAQLNRARAEVQRAQADVEKSQLALSLAQTTLKRYEEASPSGAVAKLQLDEKQTECSQARSDLDLARASLASAQAEVQRLEALQSFERVTAPFAGVISKRNYDVGALLSSTTGGSGRELFQLDQVDTLRVFVNVPQVYAADVKLGQKTDLLVRNYPKRAFEGRITRVAGAIDADTRTLRVQIDVANQDNLLYAGMYGQVRLRITWDKPLLLIPTSALRFDAEGLSVAIVREGRVHIRKVLIGHDLGTEVEILDGLAGSDLVVANPGEHAREGIHVNVVTPASTGDMPPATTRPR